MIGFFAWRGVPQRLDPIIARALYPLIGCGAVGAMVYAIVRTFMTADMISEPLFAVAALLFVIVATLLVLIVADPVRTPVSFAGFAAVIVVANLASLSSSISTWGTTNTIWDNWGPLVVSILILAFSELRAGRDLAAATVFSVLVVGTAAALETGAMPELASPVTSAVIASTPVILFGVGASVFSYRMSLMLSRATETTMREQSGLTRRVRIRLRELLRESGRDALAGDLVPFLEGILQRGEVTAADGERARKISAVLRSVIITDMGLPWLKRLQRAHPHALVVHDERDAAETFSMEQKVALRALITALLAERADQEAAAPDASTPDRVRVRIQNLGAQHNVFLRGPASGGETGVRARFGTSITVMNAVFGRSTMEVADGELELLFAYEQ